ncbi:MAG: D-2-hydroxyacid dehydrogenase [Salinisphaera sp.]|nr:D-2-hydroxyacid dehydrogenase [Salinisphaera sp.]
MTSDPTIVTVLSAPDGKPPGLAPLHEIAQVRMATDVDSLRATLPGTQVLMVTDFRSGALADAWACADRLRWVHATSAGVDALLFPELVASDVAVTNARGIFNRAIAEYVLGVILDFAKDSAGNWRLQRERRWRHRDTERILDRRVLVVGAGSIGRDIARLCTAAGMRVAGIARSAREDDAFAAVHGIADLHKQLGQADYVVVATPLTSQTRHLFGAEEFAAMPAHARLINVGRGPVVDTDALVDALQSGQIAGAGLDVFEQEPLLPGHPLWAMDQVQLSAHMAGDFIGWRQALTEQFLENLQRWRRGEPLANVVDKQQGYGA